MRSKIVPLVVLLAATLVSGCATYTTTLTNAKSETVTCKASGKDGLVTGYYLRKGFEDCVNNAEAHGFTPAKSAAKN